MITKNEVKLIKSLKYQKFRQKYNKFIVENGKTAKEFLLTSTYTIEEIFVLPEWAEINNEVLNNYGNQVRVIPRNDMAKITFMSTPTPVFLVVKTPTPTIPTKMDGYSIYLDNVQNPGNVGTIIRIADWFGFNNVIRSKDSADFYTPKTIQSTMGSMVNLQLYSSELSDLQHLPTVYGAMLNGQNINDITWADSGILIIGNEGAGISQNISSMVDRPILIPGAEGRVAESLNAAMATSIICHEIYNGRKRL